METEVVTRPEIKAPSIFTTYPWLLPLLIAVVLYLVLKSKGQAAGVSKISNTETIEYTDIHGVPQKIVITRNVTST